MANSPFHKMCYAVLSSEEIEDIETHIIGLQYQYDKNGCFINSEVELLSIIFSAKKLSDHIKFLVGKCESKVDKYDSAHQKYTNTCLRKETVLKESRSSNNDFAEEHWRHEGERQLTEAYINHDVEKEENQRRRCWTWHEERKKCPISVI